MTEPRDKPPMILSVIVLMFVAIPAVLFVLCEMCSEVAEEIIADLKEKP